MLGQNYYYGLIRNYVVAFGALFNDIIIERIDSSTNEVKSILVPLAYGPKERYLTRENQNPDLLRPVSQVWPRMAFEITGFQYDASRKLLNTGTNVTTSASTGVMLTQHNPVPYNIGFKLSVLSRNTEDALRIVEQIIPFFSPTLNVSINIVPDMHYGPTTIPITLKSVQQDEEYESSFESKEYVIWELTFDMKAYLYGPIYPSTVIKHVLVNIDITSGTANTSVIGNTAVTDYITVIPGLTSNGQPTSNISLTIPASQISANSDYGFITTYMSNIAQ